MSPVAHAITDKDAMRPWLVRHPLQAFDVRYFDHSDPRLFTFDTGFAQERATLSGIPFIEPGASSPQVPAGPREVALAWLKKFWRDPAKALLREAADISLEALDADTWPDREPLDAKFDRRDGVERRLLQAALVTGAAELPPHAPDELARSGVLAAGAAGGRAYAQARERTQAVLAAARKSLGAQPQAFAQSIDLDLGDGIRLTGSVDAWRCDDGGVRVFGAKPSGEAKIGDLLQFYIGFAAVKLAADADGLFLECERKKDKSWAARPPKALDAILAQDAAALRAGLRALIDLAAQPDPLFPPYTVSDWLLATPEARASKAWARWEGGEFGPAGERTYMHYAALAARDRDFLDPAAPAHAQFAALAHAVARVLDPRGRVLLRGAA